MNILVIGSGAREHAITEALRRSLRPVEIYCCGTAVNPGIKQHCQAYWTGDINDSNTICKQAQEWGIQMAIIGPEAPLEQGLADALWSVSIPVIGPKKRLARIESSKAYARNLMQKYGIPGLPAYQGFTAMQGIEDYLHYLGEGAYVVKADGLMGGKGVKVAGDHLHSIEEALSYCEEIFAAGQSLVIEEKLIGQEFSLMCFCDGQKIIPMPLVQDHKRAFAGDVGPNTGGMGSYSDADHGLPFLKKQDIEQALKINQSVLRALMIQENDQYIGVLYGGFIATGKGIYVIEFNARFGDPEALNVLSLLQSDFLDLAESLVNNRLAEQEVKFAKKATVCKYLVPKGYPDNPLKNFPIDISAITDQSHLYLAAVHQTDKALLATGSRTAAFVGVAENIEAAERIAEQEISQIKGDLFHRRDIGTKDLIEQRILAMQELRLL